MGQGGGGAAGCGQGSRGLGFQVIHTHSETHRTQTLPDKPLEMVRVWTICGYHVREGTPVAWVYSRLRSITAVRFAYKDISVALLTGLSPDPLSNVCSEHMFCVTPLMSMTPFPGLQTVSDHRETNGELRWRVSSQWEAIHLRQAPRPSALIPQPDAIFCNISSVRACMGAERRRVR